MHRISIFHYHLQPGGVTNVIELGAQALIRHLPDLELLRLVCGSGDNIEQIKRNLKADIEKAGLDNSRNFRFEISVEPEIGYSEVSGVLPQNEINALSKRLEDKYGDSLWWVHNYQLGKNPLFTAALLHTAAKNPKQKMLLHIHDFPECARFDNLEKLTSAGVINPYPASGNIVYSLINGRDKRLLEQAGIPADRLFLLNNPVRTPSFPAAASAETEKTTLKRYYSYFAEDFPAAAPAAKTVFYPVRSIRRKNILEAGLLCAASDNPVNLVVGLPGTSNQESAYSDICSQCFREGLIPGVWGSGTVNAPEVPSYGEMLNLCDAIMSSSVQEGFGYLFINAVQLKKPLFARYLDILDGIRTVFPSDSSFFYNRISIPAEETWIKELKTSYIKKIESLKSFISSEASVKIKEDLNLLGSDGLIDFSYLSVEHQRTVLKRVKDSDTYKEIIREENSTIFAAFGDMLNTGQRDAAPALTEFSLQSHAGTVEKILKKLSEELTGAAVHPQKQKTQTVQQNLLDDFAKIDYMRLIYDYK